MANCQLCGRAGQGLPNLYQVEDKLFELCGDCLSRSGTCGTCKSATTCDFQENPIDIPPVVMREIRNENQIIRQQVENPDRIRETCQKNCECFSEEFGCLRQSCGTCGKWEFYLL